MSDIEVPRTSIELAGCNHSREVPCGDIYRPDIPGAAANQRNFYCPKLLSEEVGLRLVSTPGILIMGKNGVEKLQCAKRDCWFNVQKGIAGIGYRST